MYPADENKEMYNLNLPRLLLSYQFTNHKSQVNQEKLKQKTKINFIIPGFTQPQFRDFGIGKMAGIPGFRDYSPILPGPYISIVTDL
jgi:hypothetical protein